MNTDGGHTVIVHLLLVATHDAGPIKEVCCARSEESYRTSMRGCLGGIHARVAMTATNLHAEIK